MCNRAGFVVLGLLLLPCATARAKFLPFGPTFDVATNTSMNGSSQNDAKFDSAVPVSSFLTSGAGSNIATAAASAGPGALRARSSASASSGSASSGDASTPGARARFTLYDVKFSTITVPPGNFITTSLNLELSGVTSSGFSPGASGKAGGSVNISFTLFNPITDAAPTAGQGTLSFGSNGSSKSGLLSAFLADGTKQTVKTDTFTVPLDTPLTLSVELQTNASAVLTGGGLASAAADFANTLSFPKSGPVFNLSGGATANSVDGGISSNQFTGVPEPGAAGLLILAAAAALGRRCRMRKI